MYGVKNSLFSPSLSVSGLFSFFWGVGGGGVYGQGGGDYKIKEFIKVLKKTFARIDGKGSTQNRITFNYQLGLQYLQGLTHCKAKWSVTYQTVCSQCPAQAVSCCPGMDEAGSPCTPLLVSELWPGTPPWNSESTATNVSVHWLPVLLPKTTATIATNHQSVL